MQVFRARMEGTAPQRKPIILVLVRMDSMEQTVRKVRILNVTSYFKFGSTGVERAFLLHFNKYLWKNEKSLFVMP